MAANTIRSYITIRNDTIENWNSSDSILKRGELALSLENGSFSLKAGDGVNKWKDLPFIAVHSNDISDLENAISNSQAIYNVDNKIIELETKVDETTVGSITQEEKDKIQSFSTEDVLKWKEGYNELQTIKEKISTIKTQTPLIDSTTIGEIVNVLNNIMDVFKIIESISE